MDQQSFAIQEIKPDSMYHTQQNFQHKLSFKASQRPAAEVAKSTHFSQSPQDLLLSSLDQSNSKLDDEIRLSDEDPHFSPLKLQNFNMEVTGNKISPQMKSKVEPEIIAEKFISVKHFSDEQSPQHSNKNPKVRTLQPFHVRSPLTSRSKVQDSLFIREEGGSLDSDIPSL